MPYLALVLCCIVALVGGTARADHFSGGSITYQCNGGNMYTVYLDLYADCAGSPVIPPQLNFSNSCGTQFTVNLLQPTLVQEVSPLCDASMANSACNGGPLPGFMHYRYETTLFLSPCDHWTIFWWECCRKDMVNVAGLPGMYVEATLNNLNGLCDDSPVFVDGGIPYVCLGSDLLFSTGAVDPNGHTMDFSLVNARYYAPPPTSVVYEAGYSGAQPLPGLTIDPVSGQLSFSPDLQGNYVVVVKVNTYDANGNLIGAVVRDLMFFVVPCDGEPPTSQGFSNASNSIVLDPSTLEVCDGVQFCADIVFTDPDPGNIIQLMSNVTTVLPGSTFQVTGTAPATATICWTPDAAILPLPIYISASDGQCPIQNTISASFLFVAAEPPVVPPNAGTNGNVSGCGAANVQLFPQLGGAPQTGGTWTDPSGEPHSGVFIPGTDEFGAYTYTVGTACENASATVTVLNDGGGDAGTDGILNICSNGAPVPLINSLGGGAQAGGSWIGPDGAMNGTYDPAIHPPGPYTYTVPGSGGCPGDDATVTVIHTPAPDPGESTSVTLCSTSGITNLFNLLGPDAEPGGTWSGPSNITGNYNPFLHNPGVYTYQVTGTAPCGNESASVTVVEHQAADAGQNANLNICSDDAPVDLFTLLNGVPQTGGVWAGPGGPMNGIYDPAVHDPGNYSYTVTGDPPCADATSFVIVQEQAAPDAGEDAMVALCADSAPLDLFDELGGDPQTGGTWSGPSNITGIFDPQTHLPGDYVYTIIGNATCPGTSATVTVQVSAPANAGMVGSVDLCSNSGPILLFDELTGSPQPGGIWSGPSVLVNGVFDPASDQAGVYIYTVTAQPPCQDASATVTVNVSMAPDAGGDGNIDICSAGAPVDLFGELAGTPDAGGTWNGPSVIDGTYDPALHGPGAYVYTIQGNGSCTDATATVLVNEFEAPDAGADSTVELCSGDAPVDLYTLLGGTPQTGGTWSGPANITGLFDPAIHPQGDYTYSVSGGGACPDAVATVSVTVQPAADAGMDGSMALCATDGAADLFPGLGGTPQSGGTWSGPSTLTNGVFDPAAHVPGAYVYTVDGIAGCPAATATVVVAVDEPADAGADGQLAMCSDMPVVDLFTELQGAPDVGGTWSGPGNLSDGLFDPAQHAPGIYTYTVSGSGACPDASASITVDVEQAANAGANAAATLCDAGASVDLFTLLGGSPQSGGTWSGPSVLVNGTFDPAQHLAGDYTYTISGGVICPASTATVQVQVTGSPDAGEDATAEICSGDDPVDLFTLLNGTPDPGGTWSGPDGPMDGMLDPAAASEGIYTYSLAAVAPCVPDEAAVFITIFQSPDAGEDGTLVVCENSGAVNLFSGLGGTPQAGGVWSGPLGASNGMYDPGVDVPGNYTYTVLGGAGCGDASATITVIETSSPYAGDDAAITICGSGSPVDLFTVLNGQPDAGGNWSGPAGAFDGIFDPAVHPAGNYTYSIDAPPPCVSDAAVVVVTVTSSLDAGEDAAVTLCDAGAPVDLFTLLGGSPQLGGTWSGPGGAFDGLFDPTQDEPGEFTYLLQGNGTCPDASATLTVFLTSTPSAGADTSLVMCSTGAPFDLFALLGDADPGGTWSGVMGAANGIFDPVLHGSGTYTYTIAAVAPCPGAQASVTVDVEEAPDAGVSATAEFCPGDEPEPLIGLLGTDAMPGGTWSGPDGAFDGVLQPALHPAGTYTYLVVGETCPDAAATVEVVLLEGPDAGVDNTMELCALDAPLDLLSALNGAPDQGGVWVAPGGGTIPQVLDPSTAASGTYTYTVTSDNACPSAQAELELIIHPAPQAGVSGVLQLCDDGGQVSLFDGLSGTLDAGGVWTDPAGETHATVIDPLADPAGTYTYTVTSGTCPAAVSTVDVIIFNAPDAGENASTTLCTSSDPILLLALLGGTPDPNGSWTGPDGMPTGPVFDPQDDVPGVYTYIVIGNAACLEAQSLVTINVNVAADAGTDGTLTICSNDAPVDLFGQLGGAPQNTGTWTGPDGTPFNGIFDPAVHQTGTYSYTVAPGAPCPPATALVQVELLPVPNPQIIASNSDACVPVEVTLSHDHTGPANCTWILGNGVTIQECGPVTTTYQEAGSYTVTLIIDGDNGCGSNTIQEVGLVNAYEKPTASFEALPPVIGTQMPSTYFHNYSEGAVSYLWDMGGTGTYDTEHVQHTFPAPLGDAYDVCLIAYASPQCADTICRMITVGDGLNVHVPNAFSPGEDGVNDLFKPVIDGIDPERYHFDIFDRWGQPLFSTRDPNAAWDGRSPSGEDIPQGVYVWRLHLKDSYTGIRYERTGHVTLLR